MSNFKSQISNFKLTAAAAIIFVFIAATAMAPRPADKYPANSGSFYPADPGELNAMLESYMSAAKLNLFITSDIYGILVPHAGYIYSALTAAYGYNMLPDNADYVIVIGTSHFGGRYGLISCDFSNFKMPGFEVEGDPGIVKKIASMTKLISVYNPAFLKEHSVEVQLPFLHKKLGNFKLLPFVVTELTVEDAKTAAKAIYERLKDKRALVVISTDLSHYPDYDTAEKSDRVMTDALVKMDTAAVHETASGLVSRWSGNGLQTAACGEKAAIAGIEIMKLFGAKKAKLLAYSNSGDVPKYGDRSRVVGYASMVFYGDTTAAVVPREAAGELKPDRKLKISMLKYARSAIEEYLKSGSVYEIGDKNPVFEKKFGLFVTLKEAGQLRGCIGLTDAALPLKQSITRLAYSSAFEDPRFSPVKAGELQDIDIEISVLSPNIRVKNPDEIIMGKHGVIVKKGNKTGLFLPQVAQETKWSREQFLDELCSQKAGLPKDAWRQSGTELYVFTVENFSENELGIKAK